MYKNSIKYVLHISASSLSHLQILVTNVQSTYYFIITILLSLFTINILFDNINYIPLSLNIGIYWIIV